MITSDQIKDLRERTGISVMQCKKALEDAGGDFDKALSLLKQKGAEIASKKAGRELGSGVVTSYIHSDNKMGVLLELLCETDFVAKNDEFKALADDIALHVAAMNPRYISSEEITEEDKKEARETFAQEVRGMEKPDTVKEQILDGKVDTYFKEQVLLEQPFVKDPSVTINGLVLSAIQKIGEKIAISRFKRFAVLEE